MLVIAIESIIGAGKTTLINVLYRTLTARGWKVTIVKEPVDKWEKSGILKLFYSDPMRWGYLFQTAAFHDRIVQNIEAYNKYGDSTDIFILERSPLTDKIFMGVLYDDKIVNDLEYKIYQDWWKLWYNLMPYTIDLFVYLKPTIDICMKRVEERSRNGESDITKTYQQKLLDKHDSLLSTGKVDLRIDGKNLYSPCILLETDDNFRDVTEIQEKITDIILKSIVDVM